MTTQTMVVCFWVCAICIALASVLGITSIWIDDLWERYSWAWKLNQTSGILGVTAMAVALVVWAFKWLVK